ncbi:MAG: TPM domain-containing protein [Bacteroidales bacterium]|nr:TPM domain-containing protein [Bacteroidales bacterium]
MKKLLGILTIVFFGYILFYEETEPPVIQRQFLTGTNELKLVYDDADLIGATDEAWLQDSLTLFDIHTSTQIVVITKPTLDFTPIAQYAQKIGEDWGVGQADKNNGIVIVVKPKSEYENGEAFIATGYGMEGVLPDALCSQIVNRVMIPYFKEDNYAAGIQAGAVEVMKIAQGEYKPDYTTTTSNFSSYSESDSYSDSEYYSSSYSGDEEIDYGALLIILVVIILICVLARFAPKSGSSTYSSGGGHYHSSSWGGSSRSFGGGHFGGGGGGGSW